MTEIYPLREHTRGERVAVHKFGFDKPMTESEEAEYLRDRLARIAARAKAMSK